MIARPRSGRVGLGLAVLLALSGCGAETAGTEGADPSGAMILATTTSTQDSGLLDAILPAFEKHSDCVPKTVAVGSGQAIEMGEKGDADVLLVHSPASEEEFMAAGHGVSRDPVMHNDFVLVGPEDDPADTADATDAADALRRIADAEAAFASRADDSGTHTKELALWSEAGIEPAGSWYIETGQGMGPTLTIAGQKAAYTLSDRATFLATTGLPSQITYEGSQDLLNRYHVIVAERAENQPCAEEFSTWIRSDSVQKEIAEFGVEEYGEQLFFPDAVPQESN